MESIGGPVNIDIYNIANYKDKEVIIKGWVYSKRGSSDIQFLQTRDGSGFIQCVFEKNNLNSEEYRKILSIKQETSIIISGTVVKDQRSPFCGYEIHGTALKVVSEAEEYPISKKSHGDAFLMDNRHLWLRSMRQHAIMKIRSSLVHFIREYLYENNFTLIDSPIFTSNPCENTSSLFKTKWFNDKDIYLSQSGQLYQEAACAAFGKTYCFGPVFRAEKSKTRKHLNEFWMVEPEVSYADIEKIMEIAEDFLRDITLKTLKKHEKDLKDTLKRDVSCLENIKKPFPRISYSEAILMINKIRENTLDEKLKNELKIEWGMDFGAPHETELTKKFDRPIIVYNFPSEIKAFYMKKNPRDSKEALCMDILAPEGFGEIIGGGQREDRKDLLKIEIEQQKLSDLDWFLDIRKYGSVPHSGFGLGLERVVSWICNLNHVRESIPFARTLDRTKP